ncbi:gamma-glutamyltransferase [Halohasta salina]|uniref:gamma-glutamyltransferase n=1 Tax=Halohasta salina TaxID=2961621 RepID=UPI0020A4C8CB|nr:gamma-glutamyltransferase [Halohasta salina]
MYSNTPTGRPPTRAQHGLITSPHYLASSTGVDVLRDGGSAVDAAIAANATLCVVYPHMAGLGGDGFWLIAGDDADVEAINASGPAAEAATREYYTALGYDEIPERGSGSALTVPGAVDGWRLAHEKHGKLPWARLFEDAITYARRGVAMTDDFTRWIALDADVLGEDQVAAETFLVDGAAPDPGAVLRQPDLADSLAALADHGPRDGFYEGSVAEAFCAGLGEESPLTPKDFEQYTAEWVDPLSVDYRGFTAYSLPPNTQGIAALQILGLLAGFDVESWGDGTADYYHHMAEAVKVAFADRDAWVTDPEAVDMPADRLLSASYLDERRELIDAASSLPAAVEPGLTPEGVTLQPQDPGGDTCYLSVVDDDGLAVSMIQSIYFDFGSGMITGDTGIIPQNRGSFFSLDASHVNRLEPGKRTFHTLIPSLLTRDGEPWLVYGTMGGEGQPQTQAALVSRIVDFGYDVQQAIEAPRWLFGRTWGEESKSLSLEGRIPDGVATELQGRGQPVAMVRDVDDVMGHAGAIRLHADGTLEGGADPRGDGAAIGY